jgi:peptidoglycan DL-endopeptidase CwlO
VSAAVGSLPRQSIAVAPAAVPSPFFLLCVRPKTRRVRSWLLLAVAGLSLAALATPAALAEHSVASKKVEARQVLGQIELLDRSLDRAVQAYDAATLRLQQVKTELRANRRQLAVARASLQRSQRMLAGRLVESYTSGGRDSSLEVLLGATSLEALLNRVDAQERVVQQDAIVLQQVARLKRETEERERRLERARARQAELVVERAAARNSIEQQLASRRHLLDSIRDEITRLQAAERARQAELQRQAAARLAAQQAAAQAQALSPFAAGSGSGSGSQAPAPAPSPEPVAPPAPSSGNVVSIAMRYLGVPYRWGGASPATGFDCSGFVMYVYAQVGISLPHYTVSQYGMGSAVSRSQLQAGDVVFFDGLGHNGIYIGGNQFIHAPHTGDVVKISSISGWYASTYVGARRY